MVLVAALFFMLLITEAAKGELPSQNETEETEDAVLPEDETSESAEDDGNGGSSEKRSAAAGSSGEAGVGEAEAEDPAEDEYLPEEYLIADFPLTLQMPELPTGCEITALTMAINYYGFDVDKTVMASEYLPTAGMNLYYGADGRLYGTDLNEYFIGDPFTEDGVICGTGAIVTAADSYLETAGSSLRAEDLTGSTPEELYLRVSRDQPVVVWVTISMADRGETEGWYTESGEYVEWSHNDHGAVLIGYSGTTVTIADPISGLAEYDRQQFEKVFADRGNQCVVIG